MARNGSGTYNLLTNSWNPATNGNSATAVDWQNLINDVASALTQSLSADGQTPITGNLNAGNNKITGLAAGSATGDSLRWEQLFSQGQPANLASAATTDIGAQNTVLLNITGTTTITSFGTNYNGPRYVRFDGVLTLTHNATTLILPGAANITTEPGDSAIVVPSGSPANGWRLIGFQKGNGDLNAIGNVNVSNLKNISYIESPGQSLVNVFRQASSGATILANGYKYSNTANAVASSFSAAWPKSAISLDSGSIVFYGNNSTTVPAGNDTTPTELVRITPNGVGVGTSSPTMAVDVRSPSGIMGQYLETTSGNQRRIRFVNTGVVNIIESTAGIGSTSLGLSVDGAERLRLANDGSQSSVIPGGGSTLLPQFACRSWVNFNGTGTVAIRASGNVSSITDNGTGDYTVNFITAMPDANYSAIGTSAETTGAVRSISAVANTTTTCRLRTGVPGVGFNDCDIVNVAIFR
ncbi:MAG: hypothetical protein ING36_06910 [Burkholderiales bacterium]|uniref:hypothetical protein n=2 Tax=unclassified Microcystis TaxID=2643300 RepID=UPI00258B5BC5|nr:hypothetical protein [Microcystis sp. M018S1]MCA2930484.1 hypothetical protein [Microcystis sp. M018S1]MCA3160582.1 hypothetical protein [Burkholderiales bacterium]MCA3175261.1 hypothetical protein [Burkholderiales bacterium]